MREPGRSAIGAWSGGRFLRFGEAVSAERLEALLRPGAGIDTVLTADVYGQGEADSLLGRALRGGLAGLGGLGGTARRLAGLVGLAAIGAVGLPGLAAETQVMALDLAGVAVSAGSACSSGKVTPSHVLRAMGADRDLAASAIRVSLGWASEAADVGHFLQAWGDLYRRGARAAPAATPAA